MLSLFIKRNVPDLVTFCLEMEILIALLVIQFWWERKKMKVLGIFQHLNPQKTHPKKFLAKN